MSSMEGQVLLSFMFLTILFSTRNANGASIQIINSCYGQTIWPGVYTKSGTRVTPTGFKMDYEDVYDLNVPDSWSGTIWARTGCNGNPNNNFHCAVGDCGTKNVHCHYNAPHPPVTQLKFNLAPKGGSSSYKIDLRDGFNLPATLTPLDSKCKKIMCFKEIRNQCPDWLGVYSNEGRKVACKSPCYTTGEPKHCCTGEYASPEKCGNEYTELVDKECPSAVSNAFDETHFTCLVGLIFW
ncbi:Thaumatin family [Sesbania bispinosa]|nr:Thaumatin family [Sesbania bispinosa]